MCTRLQAAFVVTLVLVTGTATRAWVAVAITGTVRDASGGAIKGAEVLLMTPDLTTVAATRTDAQGKFSVRAAQPGIYLLLVRAPSFGETRLAITVTNEPPQPVDVTLEVGGLSEDVTVSASRETVEDLRRSAQPVNVINGDEIADRVKTVVAQAIEGEAGVQLQRTSPTMAGIFVRGLTGNKVNVFVDGVRYSNGAQRGGVNTFLDLIDPESLETIEVVRGPSSAQYGSDALGGSVQFYTKPPALGSPDGPRWRGWLTAGAGTGHLNGGGSALLGYTGQKVGATASVGGRRTGRIRPGEGVDSHAAVTRFFGISSDTLMDDRLPDTGFHQWSSSIRANWVPSPDTHIVAGYMRSNQDDGKRYDQLLGGDGNLIANLEGLSLNLASIRLERLSAGPFEHVSLTYSVNSQREERVNQGGNGNPTATIGHEPERTTVHGAQAAFSRQLSQRQSLVIGGDLYLEKLTSDAFNVNPVTGTVSPRRPRVPSGATFRQGGVYAQSTLEVKPDVLKVVGSVRYGGASYEADVSDSPIVNGQPLWPSDTLDVSSVTYRASAVATPSERWGLLVSVSRGFRAPHMTDLGTLGLTGSGYEVAAPDVAGLSGTVGTTADAAAVSTGDPVEQVGPETSLQYEASVRYRRKVWRSELTVFINNIHDNIQKQALILPQGATGVLLGGQPIVSQNANGAVFVAATTVPVLVRANFDDARLWGIEHAADINIGAAISVHTAFTYLRAKDKETGLPPNIEGGTPAPEAWLTLRWKPGAAWWIEPYAHVAWSQTHLSSLDLGDRRTGAGRSRASIRAFFLNGARARGWIGNGPDGIAGSADDVLTVTGETLGQIQDRVLGPGVNSGSLYSSIPGYATFGARAGFRRGAHEVVVDVENLTDENYRGISWGVDAPGRGVSLRYTARF
ncbi:MAG: TonB-dependent receptor [Acidobacteria bacterium]|nr:TonB-dependent receptor [Acidobacteriota bacterium]MCA1652332.1 TonB-dependent receptor [Acidobacteriota bacterium]